MQVPISYFDPNNGQAQNLEQRCTELFANGVSEITITELGVTYTSDPLQVTQLTNDVIKYYENISPQVKRETIVTATVVVDDEITVSELEEGEHRIEGYATFASICGVFIGLIGLLLGGNICGEDPVIGGTIIGFSIGSCVTLFLLGSFLQFVAKLSAKVRQLDQKE